MQAPVADLAFDVGSADSVQYQILEDGSPVDLTGATITQEIRCTPGAPVKLTLATGSGISVIDATQGVFEVTYSSANLVTLGAGTFSYDIFTTLSGTSQMRVRGSINIRNRVTVLP